MPPRLDPHPAAVHRAVAVLATCQHGLFTGTQAAQLGADRSMLRNGVRSGRYDRLATDLYVIAGAPPGWHREVAAAVLSAGPDAVASHRTAAALHGLDGFTETGVEVTTVRGARRKTRTARPYRLHESTDLRPHDIELVGGLVRTTLVRTLIDLGASASRFEVERAFDDAVQRQLVTPPEVLRRYLEVSRQGRRGFGAIGAVLRRRDEAASRSNTFEKLLLRIVREAGLPEPTAQHRIEGPGWAYWVDFAWPEASVVVECDSLAFHTGLRALQHDDTRQNRLVLAGWTVLRFTWDDLRHRPQQVAAQIASVLETRLL